MRTRMRHNRFVSCRHRNNRGIERAIEERDAGSAVRTPSGPVAAAEAFAWLNRQLSWQSTLAELEAEAGFAGTGAAAHTGGEAVREPSPR